MNSMTEKKELGMRQRQLYLSNVIQQSRQDTPSFTVINGRHFLGDSRGFTGAGLLNEDIYIYYCFHHKYYCSAANALNIREFY